jgi:lysozyme
MVAQMQISDKGLNFIVEFEGKHRAIGGGKYIAYRCPANVLTIYTGITEGVYEGMVVTEEEGKRLFRNELAKHEAAVNRVVTVDMTQNQFDALVSFSYNLGTGALAASSIVKQLNAGKPEVAARFFAPYCNARVNGRLQPLPGLVRRRAAETAMFLRPDAPSEEPDMPQAVVAPPATPAGSRKVAAANAGQGLATTGALSFAGISVAESLGYADQVAKFIKQYGVEMALMFCIIGGVTFAAYKYFTRQDYEDGRYLPSGASK